MSPYFGYAVSGLVSIVCMFNLSYKLSTKAGVTCLNETRAGLHLVFTREVLGEIPTAMLAITGPRVTSYSITRGVLVRSGRCGW